MILRIMILLLAFTTLYSSCQGLPYRSWRREKRQNFAELLQQLLRNPGIDPSISMLPKLAPTDQQLTLNVNHPESKPTTVIHNHAYPYSNSICPCERYLRLAMNSEPVCLCPKQQILAKCEENTACVPRYECNHGFITSRQMYSTSEKDKPLFCDEATHVCCTPQIYSTESDKPNQIYNHIVNSTIGKLHNSVNKYIISGNVYLDIGNSSQVETTEASNKFQVKVKHEKPQTTTTLPIQLSSDTSNVAVEEATKLYVSDIPTTFRPLLKEYTSAPQSNIGLVRPTKSSVAQDNSINTDSRFTSAITSKPLNEDTKIVNSVTTEGSNQRPNTDLLTDAAISSVFGKPPLVRPNKLTFPGLSATSTTITEVPITTNLIQNVFEPKPDLNFMITSMKQPFFSAKVEQLKNNTKTNSTNGFQKKDTTGIGKRIWRVEASIPSNNLLVDGKVMRESTTNFQQFIPPALSVNTFMPIQSSTEVSLKSSSVGPSVEQSSDIGNCPGRLKCVQTIFCSVDGLISTVPVLLSEEDQKKREMLLDCGNRQTGQIGKCCINFNN